MITRRTALLGSAAAPAIAALLPGVARSADKQLARIISSGAAGSISDMLARPIATGLTTADRTVVVENRPGAGGFVAMAEVMRSPADGNTLVLISPTTTIWNKYLYKKLPYDPADIVAVSSIAEIPHVLAVRADFPASNVREFVSAARKNPGQVTFGFGQTGGAAHVSFARFASVAGFEATPVAYKSGPPALQDLMGGRIDAMLDGAPLLEPHIKSGRLKALAVATQSRLASLPDVPTFAESGYPDYKAVTWVGIGVRKGTPPEIVKALNAEINKVLRQPQLQTAYGLVGALVRPSGLEEFTEFLRAEDQMWGPELKKAKITIE